MGQNVLDFFDFTIFVTFPTPNESTNFLIEQCPKSIFGKRGCFSFLNFHSTDMLFGVFSFWQLSSTFWPIVSAAAVSHGYNRFFFFFNWDSLHARLNSHYEAWSYKKGSTKKRLQDTENLFKKNLQLKDVC